MTNWQIFKLRLWLQGTATVATTVATGAVTFELLGHSAGHDLASLCLLLATACNTCLLGMSTWKGQTDDATPPKD